MVIKVGRFGRFLACTGYPDCKNTKPLNGQKEPVKIEPTGEKCPDCGGELVKRQGRFGEFVGCGNYPKCKYIKKEAQQAFGSCPACGKGKIVAKHSRRGVFYACNQYPDCKTAFWSKPYLKEKETEPERCPDCSSILLYGPKETIKCSNSGCKYKTGLEN